MPLDIIDPVIGVINFVLSVGSAGLGVFAAVDAVSRRADVFPAADRQTKGAWAGISLACAVVLALGIIASSIGPESILWIAALVGTLVYLLDVRPKLREVQRGSRW